jgi:hypothetical protein
MTRLLFVAPEDEGKPEATPRAPEDELECYYGDDATGGLVIAQVAKVRGLRTLHDRGLRLPDWVRAVWAVLAQHARGVPDRLVAIYLMQLARKARVSPEAARSAVAYLNTLEVIAVKRWPERVRVRGRWTAERGEYVVPEVGTIARAELVQKIKATPAPLRDPKNAKAAKRYRNARSPSVTSPMVGHDPPTP